MSKQIIENSEICVVIIQMQRSWHIFRSHLFSWLGIVVTGSFLGYEQKHSYTTWATNANQSPANTTNTTDTSPDTTDTSPDTTYTNFGSRCNRSTSPIFSREFSAPAWICQFHKSIGSHAICTQCATFSGNDQSIDFISNLISILLSIWSIGWSIRSSCR